MPQLCIASPTAGTSPTIEAVITTSASYRPYPYGKLGPAVDGQVSEPTGVLGSACRLLLAPRLRSHAASVTMLESRVAYHNVLGLCPLSRRLLMKPALLNYLSEAQLLAWHDQDHLTSLDKCGILTDAACHQSKHVD